jgi:hypothetical protein
LHVPRCKLGRECLLDRRNNCVVDQVVVTGRAAMGLAATYAPTHQIA